MRYGPGSLSWRFYIQCYICIDLMFRNDSYKDICLIGMKIVQDKYLKYNTVKIFPEKTSSSVLFCIRFERFKFTFKTD